MATIFILRSPFVNYSFVHSRSFRSRWNFDEKGLTCRLGKLKGRGKCGKKKKGVAVWRYRYGGFSLLNIDIGKW